MKREKPIQSEVSVCYGRTGPTVTFPCKGVPVKVEAPIWEARDHLKLERLKAGITNTFYVIIVKYTIRYTNETLGIEDVMLYVTKQFL